MSAQKTNLPSTSDTSRGEPSGQRNALSRRGGALTPASLLVDPFDMLSINPFSFVRRLQQEMNRAFVTSRQSGSQSADLGAAVWVPAIEVAERDGNVVISAELPGLSDEDVTVEIDDDAVVIQGERQVEREEEDQGICRTERSYGQFYRAIPLPDGADLGGARAEFINGVLRITIPVAPSKTNPRQIPIETSASTPSSAKQAETPSAGEGEPKSEAVSGQTAPAQKAA
jgi:HSP20 family protein